MVTLPKKKAGLISCSGEELVEGTISRVATRLVLEALRPEDTVTLCLPLFLAGGQEERAFARFYPTIAIDGCSKLCAKRATEKYSAPVAGSIVVSDLLEKRNSGKEGSACAPLRKRTRSSVFCAPDEQSLLMSEAGLVAAEIAGQVDAVLAKQPTANEVGAVGLDPLAKLASPASGEGPTCACKSGGLPVTQITVGDSMIGVVGLSALFAQALARGLPPDEAAGQELLKTVSVYNYVPAAAETTYAEALAREYARFCRREVTL